MRISNDNTIQSAVRAGAGGSGSVFWEDLNISRWFGVTKSPLMGTVFPTNRAAFRALVTSNEVTTDQSCWVFFDENGEISGQSQINTSNTPSGTPVNGSFQDWIDARVLEGAVRIYIQTLQCQHTGATISTKAGVNVSQNAWIWSGGSFIIDPSTGSVALRVVELSSQGYYENFGFSELANGNNWSVSSAASLEATGQNYLWSQGRTSDTSGLIGYRQSTDATSNAIFRDQTPTTRDANVPVAHDNFMLSLTAQALDDQDKTLLAVKDGDAGAVRDITGNTGWYSTRFQFFAGNTGFQKFNGYWHHTRIHDAALTEGEMQGLQVLDVDLLNLPLSSELNAVVDYAVSKGYSIPSDEKLKKMNIRVNALKVWGYWDQLDAYWQIQWGDETLDGFQNIDWKNPTDSGLLLNQGCTYTSDGYTNVHTSTTSIRVPYNFNDFTNWQFTDGCIGWTIAGAYPGGSQSVPWGQISGGRILIAGGNGNWGNNSPQVAFDQGAEGFKMFYRLGTEARTYSGVTGQQALQTGMSGSLPSDSQPLVLLNRGQNSQIFGSGRTLKNWFAGPQSIYDGRSRINQLMRVDL